MVRVYVVFPLTVIFPDLNPGVLVVWFDFTFRNLVPLIISILKVVFWFAFQPVVPLLKSGLLTKLIVG